jgi:hypothetical protein
MVDACWRWWRLYADWRGGGGVVGRIIEFDSATGEATLEIDARALNSLTNPISVTWGYPGDDPIAMSDPTDDRAHPSSSDDAAFQGANQRVDTIIEDFNKGLITRPNAERLRDRTDRALRDMDAARGIGGMRR